MKITKAKQKKLDRRELKRQDKEWAKAVKERDGNKCVICGATKYLNAHHIIPREVKEMRHEIDNGLSLCPKHHKWNTLLSAHRNPLFFLLWFETERKTQYFNLLLKALERDNEGRFEHV